MNAYTKLSTKGQVVIPSDVRAAMGWEPGTELTVTHRRGEVVLKPRAAARKTISIEEFRERMPKYTGPVLSLKDIDDAVERLAAEDWKRFASR